MKKLILLMSLALITASGFSQDKMRAAGIRGGLSSGFEYRVFANEYVSYKALLSTRNRGIQLTGMKEFHVPDIITFSEQVTFVYGFGVHAGFESWYVYRDQPYYPYHTTNSGPIIGLDGLAALEYQFWDVPLNMGIEVKPYFDIFGRNFFRIQPFDFAFTIKYLF